jgi:S1-C subfamily serine protease
MDIPVGVAVDARVRRAGKDIVLHVTPREREYAMRKNVELSKWGITARNLSLMDSKEMKRENRDGVVVTSVRPGGACRESDPKVAPGDVIVGMNDNAVKDIEGLIKLSGEMTKGKTGPVPVLVTFDREKERFVTVVKLSDKDDTDGQGVDARKPWLPIATQVVTKEIAAVLGDPGIHGMRITRVYPGSGAEKAGLLVGDVITAVNAEDVNPSTAEDSGLLEEIFHQYSTGSKVELKIIRGGVKSTIEAVLEQSPISQKDMKRYTDKNFEFGVRDVSFLDDVREGGAKEGDGVLVESVSEGGWASLARLSIGDLILSVDGRPVADAASFETEMKRAKAGKPKSVMFEILRGIHTMFIEVEPAWPDVSELSATNRRGNA